MSPQRHTPSTQERAHPANGHVNAHILRTQSEFYEEWYHTEHHKLSQYDDIGHNIFLFQGRLVEVGD